MAEVPITEGRPSLSFELIAVAAVTAVALVVAPMAASAPPHELPPFDYGWLDIGLTLAAAGCILLERWRIGLAFWVMVALASTAQATGHAFTLAVPALAYLAFLLAVRSPRRVSLTWAGWATIPMLGTIFVPELAGMTPGWRLGEGFLWLWIGIAGGLARRSHLLMVAALKERAEKAEAAQEEVALRLVAEDRVRIARELHDVLAHHVSAINVQAGVARHLVRQDPDAADTALRHVRAAANSVMTELQSVLGVLRQNESLVPSEPALTPVDLADTIQAASALGLALSVSGPTQLDDLAPLARHAVHRFLQEALTNAGRHAPGASVSIRVARGEDFVIEVRNPAPAHPGGTSGAGFGLIGMRERIGAAGGTLTVEREDDFILTARLPLEGTPR